MVSFKSFLEKFISEENEIKRGRGGSNKSTIDSPIEPFGDFEFKYFSIDGEFTYIVGNVIGRKSYFDSKGISVGKTVQRCVLVTNTKTNEHGYASYGQVAQYRKRENFPNLLTDEAEIEPDTIDGKTQNRKIMHLQNREMNKIIQYVSKKGEKILLKYVDGSGNTQTGKYQIDGYNLYVDAKYAQTAAREHYNLNTILANARGVSLTNNRFIDGLKKSGYENIRTLVLNGEEYTFINIPKTTETYVANGNVFEPVNLSQLKTLPGFSQGKNEYEVDDDFISGLLSNTSRKIELKDIKGSFSDSKRRILNWKKKEQEITKNLKRVFSKTGDHGLNVNGNPPKGKYDVNQVGGSVDSDISVQRVDVKRSFSIECKLNYDRGEYFKFELDLVGRELKYSPSTLYKQQQKTSLSEIFGNSSNDFDTILNMVMQNNDAKKQINGFYENIEIFLKKTNEFIKLNKNNPIVMQFFEGIKIITDDDDLDKMVFPVDLKPLLQCFYGYLNFVESVMRNVPENVLEIDTPFVGLYKQLMKNLQDLFNVNEDGVDKFFVEYKNVVKNSDAKLFEFLFKHIISTVRSKNKNKNNNILKLFRFELNSSEMIADKINEYYSKVHNCRYLEIGTNPFGKNAEFNEHTWKSNIYILDVFDDGVPKDPLNLMDTYKGKVSNMEDFKKLPCEVFCIVGDSCSSFDFRIIVGKTDKNNASSNGINAPILSFEDISYINMKQEL